MKALIVVEMLLLWVGGINKHLADTGGDLQAAFAIYGVRSAIPSALLAFWLLLIADLGADDIAALLGGLITLSYILSSSDALIEFNDRLLSLAVKPEEAATVPSNTAPAMPLESV